MTKSMTEFDILLPILLEPNITQRHCSQPTAHQMQTHHSSWVCAGTSFNCRYRVALIIHRVVSALIMRFERHMRHPGRLETAFCYGRHWLALALSHTATQAAHTNAHLHLEELFQDRIAVCQVDVFVL